MCNIAGVESISINENESPKAKGLIGRGVQAN